MGPAPRPRCRPPAPEDHVRPFDIPISELEAYRSSVGEPADFAQFWARTLQEARAVGGEPESSPVSTGLRTVDTFDVAFAGFGGDPVRAWLHRPAGVAADEPLPAVVQFRGYGGGRGLAHDQVLWASAGYAHLVVDTRGQGSGWSPGDTADPVGSAPAHDGFLTRGVLDPDDYYYRRVFTDAVRAIDAVRALPGVDASRIAVTGHSQGGGITLAVAALVPDVVAAMPDVPFLCDMRRATELIDTSPYDQIGGYLRVHRDDVERVFATLSYFDGVVMGRHARAAALFSVGLMDDICPAEVVYGAFNAYAGPKEIAVYPYNGHEGGEAFQERRQLEWLHGVLRG
jgi:cephalosporin-C deacetylase